MALPQWDTDFCSEDCSLQTCEETAVDLHEWKTSDLDSTCLVLSILSLPTVD